MPDHRRTLTIAVCLLVAVVASVAFMWVWIGQWSIPPGRYDSASDWWREYAVPRAAWSLVVGLPLACIASLSAYWFRARR